MSVETILTELTGFVNRKIPGISVSGETDLRADVPFDSLDRMELFVMIERRFGVSVSPERYLDDQLRILGRLAEFIAEEQLARKR